MNWMTALLALIPTILLVVQGSSYLSRTSAPLYVRRFGILCGMLAGLSFVLWLLLASGTLVLSSEFDIVMGQGPWARFGIALLLHRFRPWFCDRTLCMLLGGWAADTAVGGFWPWVQLLASLPPYTTSIPPQHRRCRPVPHLCLRPLVATSPHLHECLPRRECSQYPQIAS